MKTETQTTEDVPVITVSPLHLKRLTGYTAICSEHGLIPSKRVKRSALSVAQQHALSEHDKDVQFVIK